MHGYSGKMQHKPLLLIVHQKTSDPGRVGRWLAAHGFALAIRCPALGAPLPATMDDHAGGVVFGGPISANDDHLDFIRTELDWVGRCLEEGTPLLGICLGAQMMARALGGQVAGHPGGEVEIGFWPIRATPAGRALFGDGLTVYQWHREGIDLPAGVTALADSDRFANQAFEVTPSTLGIQFHAELTTGMMNRWLQRGAPDLSVAGTQGRADQIAARRAFDPALRRWLDRFLAHWTHRLAAPVS